MLNATQQRSLLTGMIFFAGAGIGVPVLFLLLGWPIKWDVWVGAAGSLFCAALSAWGYKMSRMPNKKRE